MNYNNISKRLEQIQIEDFIWIVYLFIIGFSLYANSLEKDYFLTHNIQSKNTYRKINALVFLVLIIVYSYFEKEAINSLQNQNKSEKQEKLDILSFIATTAVLISGIIFLYIILEDDDLEEEVAFN